MALALVVGRLALAVVFAVAGVAKLRDLPGSRRAIGEFGVPAGAAAVLGTLLPLAELAIAGTLLAGPTAAWGALAALALLLLFCVAIAANLARGRTPDCHCFGQLHSAPASGRTVARNLALAAVAFLLAAELGEPILAAALAVAGGGALVGALTLGGPRRREADGALMEGLPIGAPAPGFRLPIRGGGSATLDSLRAVGLPVLLLFTDPQCGPCIELAPEVARWQREHSGDLVIAVIEHGQDDAGPLDPDEDQRRTVLLQEDSEVAELYRARGTPTAVLVGADGTIASGVAGGRGQIEALVARMSPAFELRLRSGASRRLLFGLPIRRRELMVRGAAGWAALTATAAWPLQALAGGRAGRRAERCEDVFDCPNGPGLMRCENGRCVCDEGLSRCDPEGADPRKCFDLLSNKDHCGRCNHACTGAPADRDECCDGECGVRGETRCHCNGSECGDNEICTDFGGIILCYDCRIDDQRRCGNQCADPRTHRCCGNKLYRRDSLPPGDWRCCGPRHNRRLVNVERSPNHCGGCNKPCARGQVCYGGKCRNSCPPGRPRCGGTCRNPRTEYCCGGRVVQRSDADQNDRRCGPDCEDCHFLQRLTCCDGDCVNTGFDSRHCGGCNRPCPPPGTPSNLHCTCQGGGDRGCVCVEV
jgi:uncharacterized membrane protein YphA (DoxX/SURF4 family)